MARYTLTKNFSDIAETYGLFQNASGNADIEITNDVGEAGIILRPFQTVVVNQKVFARKIGNNAGACLLQVLPFRELYATTSNENSSSVTTNDADVTFDDYGNLFLNHRAPPTFGNKPLSVEETPTHYLVSVSKDSLKGQNKFLIQFDEKKGR